MYIHRQPSFIAEIVNKIQRTQKDFARGKVAKDAAVSHLILSCSFRSSICLMSSRFSDDKVHQLQTSMRHASRSPPTRRGGHLPPPTLIPSIPITLGYSYRAGSRSTEHTPRYRRSGSRLVHMQTIYVSRAFLLKREPRARNPTPWNAILAGRRDGEFHVDVVVDDALRPASLRNASAWRPCEKRVF